MQANQYTRKSFTEEYPELLKEWHPDNKISPHHVVKSSRERVKWFCSKDNSHGNWYASPQYRVYTNCACPKCKAVYVQRDLAKNANNPNFVSFADQCPELLKEWHPDNEISPHHVSKSSRERIKWLCLKDESHGSWYVPIVSRVYRKGHCPKCSIIIIQRKSKETRLKRRGSFAKLRPDLVAELHPTLNKINPEELTLHAHQKLVWQCQKRKDHVYTSWLSNRVNGSNCTLCTPKTSKQEIVLYSEMEYLFGDVEWRKRIVKEIDVYIPKYKIGIEFDGGYWHQNIVDIDMKKNNIMKENGVVLLRIRHKRLVRLSETDIFYKDGDSNIEIIISFLKNLKKVIKLDEYDLDKVERYIKENKLQNYFRARERMGKLPFPPFELSLAYKRPKSLREWDHIKNGNITPNMLWAGSSDIVYLICENPECNMKFPKITGDYSRGTGCPYCANQKVSPFNNLLVKDPETSKSWHYKRNYPVRPEDVVPGSRTKRSWKCLKSRKHEPWRSTPHNRSEGKEGCKKCYLENAGRLYHQNYVNTHDTVDKTHPWIVAIWHPDNELKPDEITLGSNKKVKLYCLNDDKHKPFTRMLNLIISGKSGCPECSPKKRSEAVMKGRISTTLEDWCKKNDLGLLKEYDPDNEYKPSEISFGSRYKAKWKCPNYPRHPIYQTAISHRTTGKENCRKCYEERLGKKLMENAVKKYGSLGNHAPEIVEVWNNDNKYTPYEISKSSHYLAKINCPSGHIFTRKCQSLGRIRSTNCNICNKNMIINSNLIRKNKCSVSLEEWCKKNNHNLLKEYNPDNKYKPSEISFGSGYKAKWKCPNYPRHPFYKTVIVSRTTRKRPTGCMLCYREKSGKNLIQRSVERHGSLGKQIPNIIKWWDKDNGFSPFEIGVRSGLNVKLICPNKHKFARRAQDFRKIKYTQCDKCKTKLLLKTNLENYVFLLKP